MTKPWIALCLLPLMMLSTAACETVVTKAQTVKLTPPSELLVCRNAPALPPYPRSQRDVAVYIAELRLAHADCKASVDDLKRWAGQ